MLEGEGVTKTFGGLAAVWHVDFQVNQGEIVGLIGPNGAGKTTLFNLISGALVPKSGTLRFKARTSPAGNRTASAGWSGEDVPICQDFPRYDRS